ncbi:MAG: sulfatase-like hydrolase/transferase [Chloroflexi bacterium]|nr:sulfatase-like hydrolase/transferase [Chloroflexota bacterium]MBI5347928.1 sulfatase-like hydrolase/transferase [Chloroflexota bacterium]
MKKIFLLTLSILVAACSALPPSVTINLGSNTPASANTPAPTNTIAPQSTASPSSTAAPTSAATPSQRPNIIFILADDMASTDLEVMPKLKSLITDQGVSFNNYLVNISLCCPSRVATLRGQYANNSKIFGNGTPDNGGFERVYELGLEKATAAVWLQNAGYRTLLAGKYMNGYPGKAGANYVPPGWTEWYSAVRGNAYNEFGYTLNENGKMVQYGSKAEEYGTDVYAKKTVQLIQTSVKEGKPFFAYVSVYAPHTPATAAPRHEKLFAEVKLPRPPSFNEDDMSDKPAHLQRSNKLTDRQIANMEEEYRKRLQSLQAVDDAVETIVNALKETNQLNNTYIFFASDNGYHLGQHRLPAGKQQPYEEDIRLPLIVRGPGVPAGKTVDHLSGNIDLASTWIELAGAKADIAVDGRSLVPLLKNNPPSTKDWRQCFLIQRGEDGDEDSSQPQPTATPRPPVGGGRLGAGGNPDFAGLRTTKYTYVEYETGEKELYDLAKDPYQLNNIAKSANAELLKELSTRLAEMMKCAGESCRKSDGVAFKN